MQLCQLPCTCRTREVATPEAAQMSDEIFLSHLPGLNKSELPDCGVNQTSS